MNVSSSTAAAQPIVATVGDQMAVSALKMANEQSVRDGEAAQKLMTSAAEVQMSGKGGNVDVTG